jgi:hypothetical protein
VGAGEGAKIKTINTMKKNFRKLQLFLAIAKIDADMFYSIEVTGYSIRLQGQYNNQIAKKFRTWTNGVDLNGHVRFEKSNVVITLTSI